MPPALALAAILVLASLLAMVSALAGILWWRLRSTRSAERVLIPPAAETFQNQVDPLPNSGTMPDRVAKPGKEESLEAANPTLIVVPDLGIASGEANRGEELARRFGGIWDLADEGATPEAIARALGQPIGQVELILNLRRPMAAAGARS